MPTFNRAHFIAEALHAIVSQLDKRDELLVIDDGSTDMTESCVKSATDRARYVWQNNAGKSVALNRALEITDGEFIWICDDDDILRPNTVALLHDRLAASDAGFVFGRYTRFKKNEDGSRVDLGTGYWPDLRTGSLVRHILEDAFPMQNASLVRRTAFEKTGPFDETLPRSIDYDMFVRLALNVDVEFVDEIIFDQRKHDGPRGPQQSLHAASDSMKVWMDCDRRIFDRIDALVPVTAFEALFDGEDAKLIRRAGLLQRACVWARHGRWPRALEDLAAAAEVNGDRSLHPVEVGICRRILNGKHGFDGAFEPANSAGIRSLSQRSKAGRSICSQMAIGGLWMLRNGDAGRRAATARFLVMILKATKGNVLRASVQRSMAIVDERQLRERRLVQSRELRALSVHYGS